MLDQLGRELFDGRQANAGSSARRAVAGSATMARASVEPPDGWAPARLLLVRLEQLGYHVEEWRVLGRPLYVIT